MGKAAARKVTPTTVVEDELDQRLATINAGSQFIGATLNMGWRLALTVLIPLLGGIELDKHLHTSPSFTLGGMMLAAVASSAAVWATIKEVNAEQAEQAAQRNKKRSKESN
jgi:hypothetical protein